MKKKFIQKSGLLALIAFALLSTVSAQAGGRSGQVVSDFKPAKAADVDKAADGDTMVRVCKACNSVSLFRISATGHPGATAITSKCSACGSTDTYFALAQKAKQEE